MRTCIPLVLLFAIAGCASTSTGIDANALSEVRKGQTTFDEVVRRFGRPNFLSKNWDGTRTAVYVHSAGRSDAALSLPAMGAAITNAPSSTDSVVLRFDERGVLSDYRTHQAGGGGPSIRYVEPGQAGGEAPAKTPQPPPAQAVSATPTQSGSSPPAPAATSKPSAAQTSKPQRDDGLPWWLPSTSTRGDRY
jgi:hypothetical protein